MADETSRLVTISEDFRTCSIAKNGQGYVPGKEYLPATPDTISDGDDRGRDPKTDGGSIGTNIDINTRNKQMAKNADGYTYGDEYGVSHPDTISDGDCKGRDPENNSGSIGTSKDIEMRNKLMARNGDGYTPTKQYCAGVPDTIADGDDKGREPKQLGEEAGTCIDFNSRSCSLSKNTNLYTKNRQYGFGNGTV